MSAFRTPGTLCRAVLPLLLVCIWGGQATAMPPRPVPYDENGRPVAAGVTLPADKASTAPFPYYQFNGRNPPSTGTARIPVLLVDFPGQRGQVTPGQFTNLLFTTSPGGNTTMRDYYTEVSRGQLFVTGNVYGWFTMPNAAGFYIMGQGGRGDTYPLNFQGLVRDAVAAADASVDFRQFDNDGPDGVPNSADDDGVVDCLFIVYSGYGSESFFPPNPANCFASTCMWMDWGWQGPGPLLTNDGKRIQLFCTASELRGTSGSTIRDIGVYCHEFAHALGLPDFWSTIIPNMTATLGQWNSLGEYCLMATGAWGAGGVNPDRPTHITGFGKAMLGWVNPLHVTVDLVGCSIPDIETSGTIYCNFPFWKTFPPDIPLPQRFFVPSWTNWPPYFEGFIVENRQRIGFDAQLAGDGLLIYHFDGKVAQQDYFGGNPPFPNWFQNAVQWSENHPLLDIECADQTGADHTFNADDLDAQNNFGDAGDYFRNSATGFDAFTVPGSLSYNGALTQFAVRNIGPSAATMTADIIVGSPPGVGHDVWVKDCPRDTGIIPSSTVCDCWGYRMQFASPDLWVDNNQDGYTDTPVQGTTNRLFVRVRNRGGQGIDYATVTVYDHSRAVAPPRIPTHDPGNPFQGLAKVCSTTVQSIAPGDSAVFQVPWYVPRTPPPPNWDYPPSLGVMVETTTDTLNWSGDISSDNNLAMTTGKKMWMRAGDPAKSRAPTARERKLELLSDGAESRSAGAEQVVRATRDEPEPQAATMVLPLNNPFDEARPILFDVQSELPPGCTLLCYLPEYMPGPPVPVPFVVTLAAGAVTPLEIRVEPGPGTRHGDAGLITVHEYDPATYPEHALGGVSVPMEVDLYPPQAVANLTAELFARDSCTPYFGGAWVSFEPVSYDVAGFLEESVWYRAWRDTVPEIDPDVDAFLTQIVIDADPRTAWWEWADIDYPYALPQTPPRYWIVALDAAGNMSELSPPFCMPSTADHGDHDSGSVRLTMTDQGICGFMEVPGRGNGFQYPKGSASLMWTGSLWVGVTDGRVANRDFQDEPVKEWQKSISPDGALQRTAPPDWTLQVTDRDGVIWTRYRDAAGSNPMGLLVDQVSVACMDPPNDDFVIVRYKITNDSPAVLSGVYAGQFMDFDLGYPSPGAPWNNHGATDDGRNLAFMWSDGGPPHVGIRLLEPVAPANVAFIHQPTWVYPQDYILDAEKLGFLSASDPAHSLRATYQADDWSVCVAAGPFELGPGEAAYVSFAILGGDDVADLQSNADAAWTKFRGLVTGVDPEAPPLGPERLAVGPVVPNPFNPAARIGYSLPRPGRVEVAVFDLLGRRVATLFEGKQTAGAHTAIWNAGSEASGLYFLRVRLEGEDAVGKMMLVR